MSPRGTWMLSAHRVEIPIPRLDSSASYRRATVTVPLCPACECYSLQILLSLWDPDKLVEYGFIHRFTPGLRAPVWIGESLSHLQYTLVQSQDERIIASLECWLGMKACMNLSRLHTNKGEPVSQDAPHKTSQIVSKDRSVHLEMLLAWPVKVRCSSPALRTHTTRSIGFC